MHSAKKRSLSLLTGKRSFGGILPLPLGSNVDHDAWKLGRAFSRSSLSMAFRVCPWHEIHANVVEIENTRRENLRRLPEGRHAQVYHRNRTTQCQSRCGVSCVGLRITKLWRCCLGINELLGQPLSSFKSPTLKVHVKYLGPLETGAAIFNRYINYALPDAEGFIRKSTSLHAEMW